MVRKRGNRSLCPRTELIFKDQKYRMILHAIAYLGYLIDQKAEKKGRKRKTMQGVAGIRWGLFCVCVCACVCMRAKEVALSPTSGTQPNVGYGPMLVSTWHLTMSPFRQIFWGRAINS